jgi:hypothetical protein
MILRLWILALISVTFNFYDAVFSVRIAMVQYPRMRFQRTECSVDFNVVFISFA